ncbi:MAG: heavy-metal-associated domain-containing protein [Chloroflexi bacterium]|nr:heavy-metal-associated domain-containing protein [Chloroflexota bacterium]
MTTKTFVAPDISCNHCVMAIQRELGELDGIQSVNAEADTKKVTITFEAPANLEKISALMKEIGYPISNN